MWTSIRPGAALTMLCHMREGDGRSLSRFVLFIYESHDCDRSECVQSV